MKKLLNFISNPKVKAGIILLFLLICYIFICAFSYVQAVSYDISNSVFRLHVLANSDSKEDQNLKYLVRDSLLDYMNNLCEGITSKEDAIALVNEHKQEFENLALEVIHEHGYEYPVKINIGNFNFPTKTYGDISLPAGMYDALRVEIGNADGKNWWCVMFPSLCFIDISSGFVDNTSKELLENNLSHESYNIVSNTSNAGIKFKFKLLELFAPKNITTAKN
jgi:stage II sporulation protein R